MTVCTLHAKELVYRMTCKARAASLVLAQLHTLLLLLNALLTCSRILSALVILLASVRLSIVPEHTKTLSPLLLAFSSCCKSGSVADSIPTARSHPV